MSRLLSVMTTPKCKSPQEPRTFGAKCQHGLAQTLKLIAVQMAAGMSARDLDQARFLHAGEKPHHIGLARRRLDIELLHHRATNPVDRPRLVQELPNMGSDIVEAEVQRALEIEDRDLVVQVARHLLVGLLENR